MFGLRSWFSFGSSPDKFLQIRTAASHDVDAAVSFRENLLFNKVKGGVSMQKKFILLAVIFGVVCLFAGASVAQAYGKKEIHGTWTQLKCRFADPGLAACANIPPPPPPDKTTG